MLEVYNEGTVSASKDRKKRVRFLAMVADLTTGKYAKGIDGQPITICVRDSSRFSREDGYDSGDFKAKLKRSRVKLHGRTGGILDYSSREGQMMDCFKTFQDSGQPLATAETSLKARLQAMKDGKTSGKNIPYGLARRFTLPNGTELVVKRTERMKRDKAWPSRYVLGEPQEVEAIRHLFNLAMNSDMSYRGWRKSWKKNFQGVGLLKM